MAGQELSGQERRPRYQPRGDFTKSMTSTANNIGQLQRRPIYVLRICSLESARDVGSIDAGRSWSLQGRGVPGSCADRHRLSSRCVAKQCRSVCGWMCLGFDDFELAEVLGTPLTVVRQTPTGMARAPRENTKLRGTVVAGRKNHWLVPRRHGVRSPIPRQSQHPGFAMGAIRFRERRTLPLSNPPFLLSSLILFFFSFKIYFNFLFFFF